MSRTITTVSTSGDNVAAERRARASIAFGRKHGFYRVLFEAGPVDSATFAELAGISKRRARKWLEEQFEAGLLRVVGMQADNREELLLPGEYVPVLLDDHGEPEFSGARALLAEHRADAERVRALADLDRVHAFADAARVNRML